MALYFFAFSDNGEAHPDEQGTDLSSFDAVKREAVSALFDLIKEVCRMAPPQVAITGPAMI
ncbi:hypothetical protein [Mesorhizobium sp. M8A.F.Ca.ET.021.01.1.1]|nr:hypothetical protein [Mesorhizobium sp. M8A.F.Ca.ET.021.01.1.1]TGP95474.1 hypothetical protein EN861_11230 [Mesorhizobium sp. M8A.F.Ca.ET.218.01.1.1]